MCVQNEILKRTEIFFDKITRTFLYIYKIQKKAIESKKNKENDT